MRSFRLQCLRLACVPLLMAQAAPGRGGFDFAGRRFDFPFPQGYCRPQGNAALLLRQMAAIDTHNVVHFALASCGDTQLQRDRIRISTSRLAIDKVLTREAFLKEYRPSFVGPDKFDLGDTLDQAADMVAKAVGRRADIDGKVEALGMDSVCSFMGGNLTVTAGGKPLPQAAVICLTTVGDRMLQISSTGPRGKPGDLERRMRLVEAVALSISAKPIP